MDNQWLTDAPRLTANEADKVVEFWLRQRLTGSEQVPVKSDNLTLPELSAALGAREEEVALLLYQIRNHTTSKGFAKPIPTRRTWWYIGAIYAGVACIAISSYSFGRSHSRIIMGSGFPREGYGVSGPSDYFNRYGPSGPILPREFGFKYRNTEAFPETMYNNTVDWTGAEDGLLRVIQDLNAQVDTRLAESVTSERVKAALALDPSQPNPLISWETFTLTLDDHKLSTKIPAPLVYDEELDRAVRTEINNRITRLLKAMKTRVPDPQTTQIR